MAVAAYAAVLSLMHVLDRIQQHPPRHHLHLGRNQIETLREKVSFLQDFLEVYSERFCEDIEDLARKITVVADEAEDMIDSHVVDQLSQRFADKSDMGISSFCQDVEKVIEKIDSIKKELLLVKEGIDVHEQQPRVSVPANSSALSLRGKNNMVGFDEHLVRIMDELTGYRSDLQIVSIVGMGGIGKTTLARNVFDHPYIAHHFHKRVWLSISQEYSVNEILCGLLKDIGVLGVQKKEESNESSAPKENSIDEIIQGLIQDIGDLDVQKKKASTENLPPFIDHRLGEKLYKSLSGRRYLIVMDDLWNIKAWNDFKLFFPDNKNGSRVMVTTRLSNMAISLGSHKLYLMDFLNDDQSWNLLCKKAFAEKGFPPELEEIGKSIAKSCKGLPLAIVVVGGLLSKSNMTREHWEFVAENLNSLANSGDDEHCLKILSLSYNDLPIHLKPCFLYTRVFSKEDEIPVSKLIKLWVAEGFLKPIKGKTLEEVAEEYLKDLISRNLILIRKGTLRGKIKTCSIHDLLKDLCLRESQKQNFFRVPKMQGTCFPNYEGWCFLCCQGEESTRIYLPQVIVASQATPPASCFVCDICRIMYPHINRLRLVRVIDAVIDPFSDEFPDRLFSEGNLYLSDELSGHLFSKEILHPTKLRYLSVQVLNAFEFISPTVPILWNLQTLVIQRRDPEIVIVLPPEIWEMPQFRHLVTDEAVLPDPPVTQIDRKDSPIILKDLQTLSTILGFRCSEDVLERIPNLKKLRIRYDKSNRSIKWWYCCLHNLAQCLHKLESLYLEWNWDFFIFKKMSFPHSLKKLELRGCRIAWDNMTIIGSLPNLKVLKLYNYAVMGPEWNPVEGEFLQLRLLLIDETDLMFWRAEKIHFPNLETLELRNMKYLKEIPSGIGEIETLHSIYLNECTNSIVDSAKEILEEQQSLGNEGLQLYVNNIQPLPKWVFGLNAFRICRSS